MRRWGPCLAISVGLLASCTTPPVANSATTTPSPVCESRGVLAVFIAAVAHSTQYEISLVRVDGSVAAKTQASLRSNAAATALPFVSASATRVYFLEGDNMLKSLSPDGTVAVVRDISGNDHIRAAFAVSPDDRHIAISTIDYSVTPPSLRLSVEDLKGGNRTEVLASSSRYFWPVAWRQGKVVVAVGDANPGPSPHGDWHPWCAASLRACVADNPYGATHGYEVVDPAVGTTLVKLASGQCQAMGLLTRAGTLCVESKFNGGLITQTNECRPELTICLRLTDWAGAITDWTTDATVWIGAINPSATQMAGCCNVNGLTLYAARSAGGDQRRLLDFAERLLWMDDNHLVFQPLNSGPAHIFTLDIGPDVIVKAAGFPVASIPVIF